MKVYILDLKTILFIFCLIIVQTLQAQKEGNMWYFGNHAAIDFNSGSPVGLTNNQMSAIEGCSSICDNMGNLLFYTNGISVWNSNHQIMPNGTGLTGHNSSTQSAVIIKKPGSSSIYYIFTIGNSMSYSEVDMSLQGGLGNITSNKNILIVNPTCEKITAVKHYNGVDFWVITHLYNSSSFYCYLLTSNGLNTTPVISTIGINIASSPSSFNKIGYLKASPNGKKIASANGYIDNVQLFDFNDSTGTLSNVITLNNFAPVTRPGPYGIEFSPNSNLLYVSSNDQGNHNVYQYNLLSGSSTDIINSRVQIATGIYFGALQLAPDNRIYVAQIYPKKHLGVIQNPNTIGIACGYDTAGFLLPGTSYSYFGLPSFYSSITYPISIDFYNVCLGDTTHFSPNTFLPIDSLIWNFGDPTTGIENTSSDKNPTHIFSSTGLFKVSLTIYSEGNVHSTSTTLKIYGHPLFSLGNDTTLCDKNTFFLAPRAFINASYLWQDSSILPHYTVDKEGEYFLKITSEQGCYSSDTIMISYDHCEKEKEEKKEEEKEEEKENLFNIPNIFSPNNDTYNDFFKIDGIEDQKWNLQIYNRWGRLIHKSLDYKNDWDGDNVSDGSYYYILSSQEKGETTSYKGWVKIMR